MLKKVYPEEGPHELTITQLFSSRELARDPRNHCVPLLDILEMPDGQRLMVMPLFRPFNKPCFQTFGEFVAFFTQICEVISFQHLSSRINSNTALDQGLQFMHERNIAHRYVNAYRWGCTSEARPFQGLHGEQYHVRPVWNVSRRISPHENKSKPGFQRPG